MSYLKFDKTIMINLQESLQREVLRTNRKGAYHCSTVVDCNTRKYHGLLVMPVPGLDDENHVLLSSFDETVIQHGAEFNLGLHKYKDDNFSPKGHKYIREYSCDTVPRTVYRVGGVIFSKEKAFSLYENRIMIRYKLEDAHSPTTLRFRPFLAFRSVKELTYENNTLNESYTEITNGIKMCLYQGYPELYMQFSKEAKFVFQPYWYKGVEYPKEQERGFPYQEDLYVPGYFEIPIEKGESVYFSAGDTEVNTSELELLYEDEIKNRTTRTSFFNCLKNSAQQFYFRPTENDAYLLAGYPWFKVRARDLFVSLPGCTLTFDDPVRFEKIMTTAIPALRNFMEKGVKDPVIKEIDQPDVLLWCIKAIQMYGLNYSMERCQELYADLVSEMIHYILDQKHPDMKVLEDGLLYAHGKEKAITWMNSTVNGKPVVPRSGYIVEFNALWYNALCFLNNDLNKEPVEKITNLIQTVKKSFPSVFKNGYGYLFDSVSGSMVDWSVRPNMIFAISLPYSPFEKIDQRPILDMVTKELLTPKGLRSLSPKSEGYRPSYAGPQTERDYSYHQGTAWPWLLGAYLEAYLRIFGKSGVSFVDRMMVSMEEEVRLHCIGTIPELFDGNPPFTGRGAISFAMNVASILWVDKMLEKYKAE
ncbi:putative glycogen debranching enzyme [Parabacteroides sp. PF5-5]|uniref:glycogen debranching enzyme N-terminal domain-containing protein n=1 Tax=unclassified Parabacteroides TaxID=2649774 RepID=UPI002474140C|nr:MULTISPECIES: glycogen debranching enzyme N-terminal domain-containing protein [unclassified Parabacteroides]MDH6304514.1 putative glycogen debranching enzyme [Parabacteroides sp. PH5-39]MDH6315334.1 putative glycogen debranching enzyme [Parabacteroides sp. PF5-13]MDH6319172.1 putative glycogen debranching enzyme [Parabacteroides sp. PH5-13]MDH6322903.1 putative glycogen debranching enzyme [Parabacteroides sp. PH5-8]MDH6326525.1 putative glycogen debranching enzyme [Parabacteroides sp. PH5-